MPMSWLVIMWNKIQEPWSKWKERRRPLSCRRWLQLLALDDLVHHQLHRVKTSLKELIALFLGHAGARSTAATKHHARPVRHPSPEAPARRRTTGTDTHTSHHRSAKCTHRLHVLSHQIPIFREKLLALHGVSGLLKTTHVRNHSRRLTGGLASTMALDVCPEGSNTFNS